MVSPTPTKDGFTYAAYAQCGCIAAVAVDAPDLTKYLAESVREWLSEGLTVRRVTLEEFRRDWAARTPKWGPCAHVGQASLPL